MDKEKIVHIAREICRIQRSGSEYISPFESLGNLALAKIVLLQTAKYDDCHEIRLAIERSAECYPEIAEWIRDTEWEEIVEFLATSYAHSHSEK